MKLTTGSQHKRLLIGFPHEDAGRSEVIVRTLAEIAAQKFCATDILEARTKRRGAEQIQAPRVLARHPLHLTL